jgi:GDP-4-dehydro-6-deoxy-D-mannose reductase
MSPGSGIKIPYKMNKILITGITGFVGSHLAECALAERLTVSGFDLRQGRLAAEYHLGEITDRAAIESALQKTEPDVIFHLAGMIKSPNPDALYKTNLLGSVALFDAIVKTNKRPVVVVASSSAVYGPTSGAEPIDEKAEIRPITHYAASKSAQEIAVLKYFNADGFPVIILRMFNLLGPGLSADRAAAQKFRPATSKPSVILSMYATPSAHSYWQPKKANPDKFIMSVRAGR